MSDHIGVTSGDGLSVDIFRKKGPAEDAGFLAVSVHIPLSMIAELDLSPDEPAPVSGHDGAS